ncbi:MAG: hypothetical protein LUQ07_01905 [Methanospirillum sp.]|nr:hypothetical protein [Methanospirillum sp.]
MNCEVCGEEVSGGSAFTCSYCGGVYCPGHRLPFNHACPNIAEWKRSGVTGKKVSESRTKAGQVSRTGLKDRKQLVYAAIVVLAVLAGVFLYLFRQ